MRQCQPNPVRCCIRWVSANPRSAVKTTYTAQAAVRPLYPADLCTPHTRHYCWDVPTRSTRSVRPVHDTRARYAPDNRYPTTSTYPGPDTGPGSPLRQRLLYQGPIEGMHVYPVVLEPAGKPPHGALREHGSAVHIGGPGRETDFATLDEAHRHPGQSLEMPKIEPLLMLVKTSTSVSYRRGVLSMVTLLGKRFPQREYKPI